MDALCEHLCIIVWQAHKICRFENVHAWTGRFLATVTTIRLIINNSHSLQCNWQITQNNISIQFTADYNLHQHSTKLHNRFCPNKNQQSWQRKVKPRIYPAGIPGPIGLSYIPRWYSLESHAVVFFVNDEKRSLNMCQSKSVQILCAVDPPESDLQGSTIA